MLPPGVSRTFLANYGMSDRVLHQAFERRVLSLVAARITDGSHFSPVPQEQGHLIANVKDMKSGQIDFDSCTRISDNAYLELKATGCVIKKGDVLLSKDGTVGRVVVYDSEIEIGALSSICLITPQSGQDARFLGHALSGHDCIRQYENAMSGSALRRLVLRDIRQITVPVPPAGEQVQVARILDTLDITIRQTEAVIDKLKQVKQGLLHDVLTRGIDTNGELRPTQVEAPHLYKKSELGWIPAAWEAVPISHLAENLDGRRLPIKESERRPGVYPYYGASGIIDRVESYILDGDYVLLGEDGENVVSRNLPLAFRVTGKIWVNNHAHIYEPRQEVDIRFLEVVLEAKDYGPWVSGSAQPKLTQDALARVRFQQPPSGEQTAIADRLAAVATKISAEVQQLIKLRQLKSGLMDDLLTGRVRVPPLLGAAIV